MKVCVTTADPTPERIQAWNAAFPRNQIALEVPGTQPAPMDTVAEESAGYLAGDVLTLAPHPPDSAAVQPLHVMRIATATSFGPLAGQLCVITTLHMKRIPLRGPSHLYPTLHSPLPYAQ